AREHLLAVGDDGDHGSGHAVLGQQRGHPLVEEVPYGPGGGLGGRAVGGRRGRGGGEDETGGQGRGRAEGRDGSCSWWHHTGSWGCPGSPDGSRTEHEPRKPAAPRSVTAPPHPGWCWRHPGAATSAHSRSL